MKNRFILLAWISVFCSVTLSCSGNTKNHTRPDTLAGVIEACQQAQHEHYLEAGLKPTKIDTDNEIERYRVYEGVPNFHMQDCVKERWPTEQKSSLVEK